MLLGLNIYINFSSWSSIPKNWFSKYYSADKFLSGSGLGVCSSWLYMIRHQTHTGGCWFSLGTRTWRGKRKDREHPQIFGEKIQTSVLQKGRTLVKLDFRNIESTKRFSLISFQLCPIASLLTTACNFHFPSFLVLPPFSLLWPEFSAS